MTDRWMTDAQARRALPMPWIDTESGNVFIEAENGDRLFVPLLPLLEHVQKCLDVAVGLAAPNCRIAE